MNGCWACHTSHKRKTREKEFDRIKFEVTVTIWFIDLGIRTRKQPLNTLRSIGCQYGSRGKRVQDVARGKTASILFRSSKRLEDRKYLPLFYIAIFNSVSADYRDPSFDHRRECLTFSSLPPPSAFSIFPRLICLLSSLSISSPNRSLLGSHFHHGLLSIRR